MSLPRPNESYHFQANLIWWGSPFKKIMTLSIKLFKFPQGLLWSTNPLFSIYSWTLQIKVQLQYNHFFKSKHSFPYSSGHLYIFCSKKEYACQEVNMYKDRVALVLKYWSSGKWSLLCTFIGFLMHTLQGFLLVGMRTKQVCHVFKKYQRGEWKNK
jgi:hypothetical protein